MNYSSPKRMNRNTQSIPTSKLTFVAVSVLLNFIGGLTVMILKLPVYLDSIGTILAGVALGPLYGMACGLITSILNAATFDPISIYFIPTQLLVGGLTGTFFYGKDLLTGRVEGKKLIKVLVRIALITLLGSIITSIIVAYVFSGVSSAGSSMIVALLKNSGVNILTAVFSTQILTDLLDRLISFGLVYVLLKNLPISITNKFS